jgi:hypothetical protein
MTYGNLRFCWGLGCCALQATSIPYLAVMFHGLLSFDEIMTVIFLTLPVTSVSVVTFLHYCTTRLPDADEVVEREQMVPAIFIGATVTAGLLAMPWVYIMFPMKPTSVKNFVVFLEIYSGGGLAWFSNYVFKVAKNPVVSGRKARPK